MVQVVTRDNFEKHNMKILSKNMLNKLYDKELLPDTTSCGDVVRYA